MSTNPLVAQARDSTQWYTGLGLVEDAADITNGIQNNSWVDGTLGGVGASLDILGMALDPIGSLVSWGVAWLMEHVKPLKDALDWLAGNPDEISAHAATWQNVSTHTARARQRYAEAVTSQLGEWDGPSGEAYRQHSQTQLAVMGGIANAATGISAAVKGAGLLVALVRGIVRDLIAQFIATLAARLPQWLAEAGATLGAATPLVIGQVSSLVAKWVNKIQKFVRALLNSLRKLKPLLARLSQILTSLKDLLRKLARSNPFKSGDSPNSPHGRGSGWAEGDPIPPPHDGGGVPTDATLVDRYRGENDPNNPNRAFNPLTVRYMSPEEREAFRLFVDKDGNLRKASDGNLFDTSAAKTLWSGDGRAIFVMDGNGNLYATTTQKYGQIHHSSLLAGDPVAGAGEIEVHNGRLVAMTDRSGHYQPTPEMNDRALQNLQSQGIQTGPDFKKYGWNENER